ncbi:enoyl-CoA hydratase-related protein [Nocardioidaceae bacterium SCSIO 66511]|nr:enoyl-CoA hydratase-related protein [Nocardioidaceae bacterium SCSIO 66511]
MSDSVRLDVHEGVARVTLNRPDNGNALDLDVAHRLLDVVQKVAADDDARVMLLRAEGRMFCAGGDLAAMRAAPDPGAYVAELAHAAHEAIRAIVALKKPIVAAVQGAAAGAGLSLVLLSDLVIAAERATFVTAYTAVGLTPDCGQSWLLPRAIGTGRAVDLMLNSPRLTAEKAVHLGVATEAVVDDVLENRAGETAARLATGPSHAFGHARWLIRSADAAGLDAHLDREAETIAAMAATDDTAALIESFGAS